MIPGQNSAGSSSSLWQNALSNKKKKHIVSIFAEAAETVDDPYWRNVLINCSTSQFPKPFTYRKHNEAHEMVHMGNHVSMILPDPPAEMATAAIYFFQEQGGIFSKRDRQQQRDVDNCGIVSELMTKSRNWKKVACSKSRRSTHIRDYVARRYADKSEELRREMCTAIEIAFELKLIDRNDVTFVDGWLTNVQGVDIEDDEITFRNKDVSLPKCTFIPPKKDKVYQHHENWLRWTDAFLKYRDVSTKACHTVIHSCEST